MAGIDPITAGENLLNTIFGRVLPDKTAKDAAAAEIQRMIITGEFQTAIAQIQTNTAEASSGNWFVAGWRPALGWTCAASLAWSWLFQPIVVCLLVVFHSKFDPALLPKLDTAQALSLVTVLLGVVGARTLEKVNGVDTKSVGGQ